MFFAVYSEILEKIGRHIFFCFILFCFIIRFLTLQFDTFFSLFLQLHVFISKKWIKSLAKSVFILLQIVS